MFVISLVSWEKYVADIYYSVLYSWNISGSLYNLKDDLSRTVYPASVLIFKRARFFLHQELPLSWIGLFAIQWIRISMKPCIFTRNNSCYNIMGATRLQLSFASSSHLFHKIWSIVYSLFSNFFYIIQNCIFITSNFTCELIIYMDFCCLGNGLVQKTPICPTSFLRTPSAFAE